MEAKHMSNHVVLRNCCKVSFLCCSSRSAASRLSSARRLSDSWQEHDEHGDYIEAKWINIYYQLLSLWIAKLLWNKSGQLFQVPVLHCRCCYEIPGSCFSRFNLSKACRSRSSSMAGYSTTQQVRICSMDVLCMALLQHASTLISGCNVSQTFLLLTSAFFCLQALSFQLGCLTPGLCDIPTSCQNILVTCYIISRIVQSCSI